MTRSDRVWWLHGPVRRDNALIPQVGNDVDEHGENICRHLSNLGHHVVNPGIPRLIPGGVSVLQRGMLVDVDLGHEERMAGVQTCSVIASMEPIKYEIQSSSLEGD